MIRRWMAMAGGLLMVAACAGAPEPEMEPDGDMAMDAGPAVQQTALLCQPVDRMPVEGRASSYDSTFVELGGAEAKLCYGRPSARGRQIFGQLVPYDTLWRTGANEPTTIHLPFAARIAGIQVEPGSYSIYTVPGREEWSVIVNRSTSQWGHEGQYTPEVRAQEAGRASVPTESLPTPVETFTIATESTGASSANLVLEWENTRVEIPIERT